jgi:RNA polymerase-interacting CarD/CdnL/TRCF family regulator|tara:strand:- start:185 stop:388 length:204 start_codon:yes stop_codon:yes gene_type:complete
MAEKTSIPLLIPTLEYNQENELLTRRTIEQAIQDLNSEIGAVKRMQQSVVSKAIKRQQFLLMGAKSV